MADETVTSVPLRTPLLDRRGVLSRTWFLFFQSLGAGSTNANNNAISLFVGGTLAIASDLAPRVALANKTTASGVTALVKTAPVGADLNITILTRTGTTWTIWTHLKILDGAQSTVATADDLAALKPLAAGAPIRLDITSCGTTSPGSDLSILIYF